MWHWLPDATQNWLVFLTGLAVIWYTWETRLLRLASRDQIDVANRQREIMLKQTAIADQQRKVAVRQLKLAIRPYVIVEGPGNPFSLKNVGAGPALNLRVLDVGVPAGDSSGLACRPAVVPYLAPGATVEITIEGKVGDKTISGVFGAPFYPSMGVIAQSICLEFENIEAKRYVLNHKTGSGPIRFGSIKD